MGIAFNQFPVNFGVPGVYAEYDASKMQQGVTTLPQKILLIGQKLAAGSAPAAVAVKATGADHAGQLAGRGSMLHQMAIAAFARNFSIPVYLLPLADVVGGTASTRTITLAGTSTEAGTLSVYVGGRPYRVPVASGAAAAAVATALAAAINADALRYVDAVAATAVVTLTARHKGVDAGVIEARVTRYDDEKTPAGLTATIGNLVAGATNPDITAALAALGDQWFPTIAQPYADATNRTAFIAELISRNGPIRQIEAVAYTAINDSVANEQTTAEAMNQPMYGPIDAHDVMEPAYVAAASAAFVDAERCVTDPALPEQTVIMPGLTAVPETERRTIANRQDLIYAGVGTLVVDSAGVVRAERFTSSYRKNAYGLRDESQFDIIPFRLWAQTRFSIRQIFTTQYARYKLGRDGSLGPNVMTPSYAKTVCIALYKQFMELGWYEGGTAFEQFKADLQTEIASGDPNRLNILFPPDFMNQLRVVAALVQPRG